MKKPLSFIMDFEGTHELLYVKHIFGQNIFSNDTTALLKCFKIYM